MLIGVTTVFVSIAILGETLLRLEMTDYFGRRRRDRMLKDISGHYIVCGAGRVGRSVIQELLRSESTVVLIDNRVERARWATDKGVITLVGDATKDEVLRQARVETAKGLVAAISSDAENVYVALSAKVLNPQLVDRGPGQRRSGRGKTPARRSNDSVHALFVHRTSPGAISCCGRMWRVFWMSRRHSGSLRIWISRSSSCRSAPSSTFVCKFAGTVALGSKYGVIVLAVRQKNGVMQFNPSADLID